MRRSPAALASLAALAALTAQRAAHAQPVARARVARMHARCALAVEPDWNHWALAGSLAAVGAGWTVAGFADPARDETAGAALMQGLGIGTAVSSLAVAIRLGAPEPIDATRACHRLRAARPRTVGEARAVLRVERQLAWLDRYARGWTRGALITASALTVVGGGVALAAALGAEPEQRFAIVAGAALGLSIGFWLSPLVPSPAMRAAMDEGHWAVTVRTVGRGAVGSVGAVF